MFPKARAARRLRGHQLLAALAALAAAGTAHAQSAPPNGPRQVDPRWHAFHHAKLVAAPGQTIENATIVIRDGVITAAGAATDPPAGARVWECRDLYVYPGLIEPFLAVDTPAPEAGSPHVHWNPQVMSQRSPLDGAGVDAKTREELRKLGFAAAALTPRGGVFRGQGALVLLDDPGDVEGTRHTSVIAGAVYHTLAFDLTGGGYPRSQMGCVALMRQTLHDAKWYAHNRGVFARHSAGHEPPRINAALAALGSGPEGAPLLFEASDELQGLVALRTAREFRWPALLLGTGTDYRRLPALVQAKARLILPLAFPDPPKVSTLAKADRVSLRDLMGWEQAPTNPRRVAESGLTAALTTHRLEKRGDFLTNLRSAIRHGLSHDDALAMLTTGPAEMLGAAAQLGSVEPGKIANFIVADGPLFDRETVILDVWVRGRRYQIHDPAAEVLEGAWTLTAAAPAEFGGTLRVGARNQVSLEIGDDKVKARDARVHARGIDFLLEGDALDSPGVFTLHASFEGDRLFGSGRAPDGASFAWSAIRSDVAADPDANEGGEQASEEEQELEDIADVPVELPTPFGAYGFFQAPEARDFVIKNATVWAGGAKFSVAKMAIAVRGGKIVWSGDSDLAEELSRVYNVPTVIDAKGKHITPGLVDCHSHTGIARGANEGTQAVTSEVRVADSLNPDDISWYRQLAGGVTAVQQLHGSANPIGGQSNVVKLRWGVQHPSEMVMRGAPAGIKFALGENVKRSRSSPQTRYPGSRMGVETLIRDRFTAAREYSEAWQRYRRLPREEADRTMQPRRDLELDALAEILGGIRLVHCHSYRQDEILMLCRLAKDFNFKIGTFQHGLECYKVADAVKEQALGASVFSDWWAYKFEVIDAIPFNGPILFKTGITVSYNSDSNELARRLNTEAAKAVKYGGLKPLDALGFVTLGPATQLGVQGRVGTFDRGKDADFVVWSDHPLSSYARCEATFIDGLEYFSLQKDAELRKWAAGQRERILQKLLRRKQSAPAGKGESEADPVSPRLDDYDHHDEGHGGDERGRCGCFEREILR